MTAQLRDEEMTGYIRGSAIINQTMVTPTLHGMGVTGGGWVVYCWCGWADTDFKKRPTGPVLTGRYLRHLFDANQ